jgi:hypothetical protein
MPEPAQRRQESLGGRPTLAPCVLQRAMPEPAQRRQESLGGRPTLAPCVLQRAMPEPAQRRQESLGGRPTLCLSQLNAGRRAWVGDLLLASSTQGRRAWVGDLLLPLSSTQAGELGTSLGWETYSCPFSFSFLSHASTLPKVVVDPRTPTRSAHFT